MKIKLYSARELDKKFPSGKWNGIEFILHKGTDKYWWRYYGVTRGAYNHIARHYRDAEYQSHGTFPKVYLISISGQEFAFPEIFVKKVK